MKGVRKLLPLGLIAAVALAGNLAGVLHAGPIPSEPLSVPSVGESIMGSFTAPLEKINVDWEVIYTTGYNDFPSGLYAYMYQVENDSTPNLDAFTVTLSPSTIGSVVGYGVLAGDDLDVLAATYHPAHDVGTFPSLAGEQEGFTLVTSNFTASLSVVNYNVTWSGTAGNHVGAGEESDTFYFLSTLPPTYGNAVAQDSVPPSPFQTLGPPNSQPVPVPIPEPASVVLLLLGAALAAARARIVRTRGKNV